MIDIPASSLIQFVIFLVIPLICAFGAKLLRLPLILGYIAGGLLMGTFISSTSREFINSVGFFGIIFLLFTVGLEVNFKQLMYLKKYILIGGTAQLIFTTIAVSIISFFFHFDLMLSLLIGLASTSSSTILVAKIIQDKGEEGSFVGEIALGVLMLQDILFIPLLIIFNSIHQGALNAGDITLDIIFSLCKSAIIIAFMFFVGQKFIPKMFNIWARQSRELLNIFIIFFIIGITYLSSILDFPVLIGVFIAGILVGQTKEHQHIFSQIRPLRDILGIVFFILIGLNVNILKIVPLLPQILLFAFLILLVKAIIILISFIKLHLHTRTAFSLAAFLFEMSEYTFILFLIAYHNKIISEEQYIFLVGSVLVSLLLTPVVNNNKNRIYAFFRRLIKKRLPLVENYILTQIDRDISPIDEIKMKDHVVICGYGRIGQRIGKALLLAHIPFVAIDYNFEIVEKAKEQGINCIYGDPTDIDILDYAEVDEAKVLISAVPEGFSQEMIVLNAQKLNPRIIIISRVHKDADVIRMSDLGVDVVVQPEFEASIAIIKKLLYALKKAEPDIKGHLKRMRAEHNLA
jgi:CPA2 family monovalent cation:H+ antiporter-2